MRVDWLIVGAGFTGCTLAERIASQLGQKVLVVERRDHIGGNAYDFYNEDGLLIHRYGPHIFHTNSRQVWDYLSQFTEWRPYHHKVLAVVEGKRVPVPFNLNSLYLVFPPRFAAKLENLLIREFGYGKRIPILRLLEHSRSDIRFLAKYVYDNVFLGYTLKQWGKPPEALDPSVTARVPVVISRDDRYFADRYQGIPKHGYSELFRRMLARKNIMVLLNTDYLDIRDEIQAKRIIYTGAIDEFFDYAHGALPYRSLHFEFVSVAQEWCQEVATINYPNDYDFTRVTEFKHLTGQESRRTALVYEYPGDYQRGKNEPYYPVLTPAVRAQYERYRKEAEQLGDSVLFVGRLADYRYYNMDQAIARALKVFEEKVAHQ